MTFFGQEFWRGVVMIAIGIPTGFGVRFGATWLWDVCFAKPEKERERLEKKRKLREALKETLDRNIYLVDQIRTHIGNNTLPTFNVDLTVLDSTASLKYDILGDFDTCRIVDLARFELAHVARKLDILLSMEFDSGMRLAVDSPHGSLYNALRPRLLQSLNATLEPATKHCQEAGARLT